MGKPQATNSTINSWLTHVPVRKTHERPMDDPRAGISNPWTTYGLVLQTDGRLVGGLWTTRETYGPVLQTHESPMGGR